jgi:hypothetical protein
MAQKMVKIQQNHFQLRPWRHVSQNIQNIGRYILVITNPETKGPIELPDARKMMYTIIL